MADKLIVKSNEKVKDDWVKSSINFA